MCALIPILMLGSMTLLPGAPHPSDVQYLGTYRGLGGQFASVVGPGPTAGSERMYATYLYLDKTLELVAIDPSTSKVQVFQNPAKGEYAARCITTGPDGNVYLGSAPGAHFFQLNPKTGTFTDLGRPSATETCIWDVTFGSDGKLYGGTNPNARLVRYDPTTKAVEDLGRMDPKEDYAHYVAASSDGFIYVGIGTAKMNIAAYQIKAGEHREIMPASYQVQGQANVYKGLDGNVYAIAGKQHFLLQGWEAKPIDAQSAAPPIYGNRIKDGRSLSLRSRTLRMKDAKTGQVQEQAFNYDGNELPIFRLGLGPDGQIYGSSALPAHLFRWDQRLARFVDLGDLGGGEVYSFLSSNHKLFMAAYGADAPLMILDPAKPPKDDPENGNPALVNFDNADQGWRPSALIQASNGKLYIGANSGYGKLGGPLCLWDPNSGQVEQYLNLIQDQSVIALCPWKDRILGGTTINGGLGSHPTQKEAKVFAYDPTAKKVLFEVTLPGISSVENLQMASDGLLYGIGGHTWFAFDPRARSLVFKKDLPFPGGTIYNSLNLGPDGRIWGLAGHPLAGIFAIDPATQTINIEARAPKPITAGTAIKDGYLYFTCGSDLYRYPIPKR